jgi:hypothetical protein
VLPCPAMSTSLRSARVVLAAALCVGQGVPTAAAGPARAAGPGEVAAFESEFQAGQAKFDAGEFLEAARTWKAAASKLPHTADQKANFVAIHDYLADAYDRAMQQAEDPAVLREALALLDDYAAQLTATYAGEVPSPQVEAVRARFRERVAALDAEAKPVAAAPEPAPAPVEPKDEAPRGKPWRGLAIGGGVALAGGAAMLGMFAVGYSRTSKFEDAFALPTRDCSLDEPTGSCADYIRKGESANAMAVAGLVLAPLMIGAGVGMLVVAMKRKRASRHAFTPLAGRGLAGVHWQWRF